MGRIRSLTERLVACVALACVAASCGSLVPHDEPVDLVVDARARIGRIRPIWDEVNLWKLASYFGAHNEDPAKWWGPDWLRRRVPWVRYGRVLGALGGNYAPEIAAWCDYGRVSPAHPENGTGECGKDGTPGSAALNEPVRVADGTVVVDYSRFRSAVERLLRSGIRPHLNLSSAPSVFTGGAVDYSHYHWNAAPVRDLDGWSSFVGGAFGAVADLDPRGWRVSIINEPNCLTLVGWEQHVKHVGFNGTPEEYASIFTTTAATIRRTAPGARIHAGNYVTSATFPGEDNLATYLTALRAELERSSTVRWDDVEAISTSLYETADTTVYELVPVRLARLANAARAAGLAPKAFKVDELEIHPYLASRFDARGQQRLDTTRFAAAWHAEAVRAFLNAGTVTSIAPWLDRLYTVATWTAYPKARTYELLGVLAGQLRLDAGADGAPAVAPTDRTNGLVRLAVHGEDEPPVDLPRSRPGRARAVGALATRDDDVLRVLVVHHQNEPVPDAAADWRRSRDVRISARRVSPGAYAVRHASIGGPDGSRWDGTTTTTLRWIDDGCRVARDGVLQLDAGRQMAANTVWLFEARRHRACPEEATAPRPPSTVPSLQVNAREPRALAGS